jgi:hypothetical protein
MSLFRRHIAPGRTLCELQAGFLALVKKMGERSCYFQQSPPVRNTGLPAKRDVAAEQPLNGPTARDQVNDRNDQGDHQQQMNQSAGHMESPAQEPEDDEDCKDRPKHKYPFEVRRLHRLPLRVRSSFSGRSCPSGAKFSRRSRRVQVTSLRSAWAWACRPRALFRTLSTCGITSSCRCQAHAQSSACHH